MNQQGSTFQNALYSVGGWWVMREPGSWFDTCSKRSCYPFKVDGFRTVDDCLKWNVSWIQYSCSSYQPAPGKQRKLDQDAIRKKTSASTTFWINRPKWTVSQFTVCLEVLQNVAESEATASKMEAPSWMAPAAPSLLCRSRASFPTFMGIPHKVPFWLMAPPRAPPSPRSWFIRPSSLWLGTGVAHLLLPWKIPVGTFTIIWSPGGRKHQTETYTHARTRHHLIPLTLGLR